MDDAIEEVIKHWPTEWHSPFNLAIGTSKAVEKKKKEVAKQKVQQLAKKRKKDAKEKACIEEELPTKEHAERQEHGFERSQKPPSPQME